MTTIPARKAVILAARTDGTVLAPVQTGKAMKGLFGDQGEMEPLVA